MSTTTRLHPPTRLGNWKRPRHLAFETLADRILMAGDLGVSLENGVLDIQGSGNADLVEVRALAESGQVAVSANSQAPQVFFKSDVALIRFHGGNGNDVFFNGTDLRAEAFGQGGADWLIGGAASDLLDGGEGDDHLIGNQADQIVGETDEIASDNNSLIDRLTQRYWSTMSEQVQQQIASFQSEAADYREKVIAAINKAIEEQAAKLEKALEPLVTTTDQAIQSRLDDAERQIVSAAGEVERVKTTAAEKVAAEQHKFDDALAAVAKQTEAAIAEAQRKSDAARSSADQALTSTINNARSMMQSTIDSAARQASGQIQTAASQRTNAIRDAQDAASRAVDRAYNSYLSTRHEWRNWQNRQEEALRSWLDRVVSALPRALRSQASRYVDQFNRDLNSVRSRADRAIETAYDAYKDARTSALATRDRAIANAENAFRSAEARFLNARNAAIEQANRAFDSARNVALQSRDRAVKTAVTIAEQARQTALQVRDEASQRVREELGAALEQLAKVNEVVVAEAVSAFHEAKESLLAHRDAAIAEIREHLASQRQQLVESNQLVTAALGRLERLLLEQLSSEAALVTATLQNTDRFFQTLGVEDGEADVAIRWQKAFDDLKVDFPEYQQAADADRQVALAETAEVVGELGVSFSIPLPYGGVFAIDAENSQDANSKESSARMTVFWVTIGASKEEQTVNVTIDGVETPIVHVTNGVTVGVQYSGFGLNYTGYEDNWDEGETPDGTPNSFDDGFGVEFVTPWAKVYRDRDGAIGVSTEVTQLKTLKALLGVELSLDAAAHDRDSDGKLDLDRFVASVGFDWLPNWTFSVGLQYEEEPDGNGGHLQMVFGTNATIE